MREDGRRTADGGGPPRQRRLRAGFVDRSAPRGPLTAAGKARAAQNALRHGLTLPASRDPATAAEVAALAGMICRSGAGAPTDRDADHPTGDAAGHELIRLAHRIAEAQIDLIRVRRARHDLLLWALENPRWRPAKGLHARIRLLAKAGELIREGIALPPDLRDAFRDPPQGAEKHALILTDASAELARMDRYERRALSRRKFAIRAFDAARDGVATDGGGVARTASGKGSILCT